MATPVKISSAGTLENLLNIGYTFQDALDELLDNSLDARATRIALRFNTVDRTLIIADNARGMTKNKLASALFINNTKPASNSIGLRGVGLKAGHAVLSRLAQPTRILTKEEGHYVYEVELDWPESIRANMWAPTPHEISGRMLPVWEANAITPEHGTVMIIPVPDVTLAALLKNDGATLRTELGRTYETRIRDGVSILIDIDGVLSAPDMSLALAWEDAPEDMRNETPIHILRNPATGEKRVYYEHRSLRPVWTGMVREDPANEKKTLRDYHAALADGFVTEGEFNLKSVYDRDWNPPATEGRDRLPYAPGYIAPCRDGRYLRAIPLVFPSQGDYEGRRVYASSRHSLEFSYTHDDSIGVQVNKNDITPENIDAGLYKVVESLAKKWTHKLYTGRLKTAREVGPDADLERRLARTSKTLKFLARRYGAHFLDEFDQWIETMHDDESVGSE